MAYHERNSNSVILSVKYPKAFNNTHIDKFDRKYFIFEHYTIELKQNKIDETELQKKLDVLRDKIQKSGLSLSQKELEQHLTEITAL